MAADFPGSSCSPPLWWVCSRRVHACWGERGTTRDLLSPCHPSPSMIADFPVDDEDLPVDFPALSDGNVGPPAFCAQGGYSHVARKELRKKILFSSTSFP